MSSAPVLELPDFTKPFTIETDASEYGMGAFVITRSKPYCVLKQSTGEEEFGLVSVRERAHGHTHGYFKMETLLATQALCHQDRSPKSKLLEQRLTQPLQFKALTKFIGLEYVIEYKKGAANWTRTILPRVDGEEFEPMKS